MPSTTAELLDLLDLEDLDLDLFRGRQPHTTWQRTFGGLRLDEGRSAQQTSDGGYVLCGFTESLGERSTLGNVYLVKLRSDPFRRGDATADGDLNLTDAVRTLNHLFLGGPAPDCEDAADANDSGDLNLTDAVFTLNHLFGGGAPPPDPGFDNSCGPDPTDDELASCDYRSCTP